MEIKTKQTWAVILSIVGSVGTVATAILTAKCHEKALKHLEEDPKVQPKERFKLVYKDYIPAAMVGMATIAATTTSTIMSRKAEASLTATAIMLDQGWRKYKDKIKTTLGIDKHEDALKSIADDERPIIKQKPASDVKTYWEEHVGYFYANPEKLALAYADMNQRLQLEDFWETDCYAMLYNLLKDSDAELLNGSTLKNDDISYGWSNEYLGQQYGYVWVHMNYEDVTADDGFTYTKITFDEEPIFNPGNYGENFVGKTEADDKKFKSSGYIPWNKEN